MFRKWAVCMTAVMAGVFVTLPTASVHADAVSDLLKTNSTGENPSWGVKTVTLSSGRKYHVLLPICKGPCQVQRQVIVYSHGASAAEDAPSATLRLRKLHDYDPNTIFAFSISKGDTKRFDVGVDYCCTWTDTNEVQYLVDVVNDIATRTPVLRDKVGLFGFSNGGMLSERAICLRPDEFAAAAAYAGTWTTQYEGCQHGTVNIEQWQGDKDTTVRLEGGCVKIQNHLVCVPPAWELGSKITPESHFALHVMPGKDHTTPYVADQAMVAWLDQELAK